MGNGQVKVGQYIVELDNPLGQGTFGSVYLGKNTKSGERVAVKQCRLVSDAQGQVAMQEIKNFQHLSAHKHIVKMLDYNFRNASFWMVLEFCDQGDLEGHMKKYTPNLDRMLKIMHQCASAVSHMHSLTPKMVHRDLKPANILFKQEGDQLVLKVADFGLAAIAQDDPGTTMKLTTQGGTIPYIAPEIFLGKNYNESVDVFAMGIIYLSMINFKPSDEYLIQLSENAERRGEVKGIGQEMAECIQNKQPIPAVTVTKATDGEKVKAVKLLIIDMTKPDPKQRISMKQTCERLEEISSGVASPGKAGGTAAVPGENRLFTSNLTIHGTLQPDDDADEGYKRLKDTVVATQATKSSTGSSGADSSGARYEELGAALGAGLGLLAMLHLALAAGDDSDVTSGEFSVGDRVWIDDNKQKVQEAQRGHGGWGEVMAKYLGEEGVVQTIKSAQIEVMFPDGKEFWYNPTVLTKLKADERRAKKGGISDSKYKRLDLVKIKRSAGEAELKKLQDGHGGYNSKMTHVLGLRGVIHKIDGDGDILVEFLNGDKWVMNPEALEVVNLTGAEVEGGDLVLVLDDRQKIVELQKGHGEWTDGMAKCLGRSGIVKQTGNNRAVVEVQDTSYIWNKDCLKLVAKGEEMLLVMLKKQLSLAAS